LARFGCRVFGGGWGKVWYCVRGGMSEIGRLMNFGDLRSLLYYVPEFRNRVFVVMVDGTLVDSPCFTSLLLDLAVLHSLNIRVVLVFGARAQIRRLAAQRGVTLSDDNGTGVTDDVTLEVAVDAVSRMTNDIINRMTTVDLRAAVSNVLTAHPAGVVGGVEQGHTGRVEKVDRATLMSFINEGVIPLIPPLGFDGRGRTLRLNSDAVAMEVATGLKALKLIYVAEEGLFQEDGSRLAQLSVAEARALAHGMAMGSDPSLVSKLRHGAKACHDGVTRVHIIDGNAEDLLLAEVFSLGGVGTMIHADDYQNIRPMLPSDVPEILEMIQQAVEDAALLHRTGDEIMAHLTDYQVLEVDQNLVGCVALHLYEGGIGEVACLYVKKAYKNQGYGRKLVTWAERAAVAKRCQRIFALSTQAYSYFEEKMSYQVADPDLLPESRKRMREESGRNARVLFKSLS
jgi:amino-acid N-acetyltransferase